MFKSTDSKWIRLGSEPTSWPELVNLVGQIQESAVPVHSPYFMNQLFSGILPEAILSESVIAQTKATLATSEASGIFTDVEVEVVRQLGLQVGWHDGDCEGMTVPGGSSANFMAIHCARQHRFPHLRKTGMDGRKLKILVSAEAHYSWSKACLVLGIGTDQLVKLPAGPRGSVCADDLRSELERLYLADETPLLVVATAGTTVYGAFDPIPEFAAICADYGVWLHVDAAWGGPALFSRRAKHLIEGVHLADSVTFDAHKLLGCALTCSFFLTSHRGLLLEANDVEGGDYLFHNTQAFPDRGQLSWQCGRRADAMSLWTLWKSQGARGMGQFVDRLFSLRDELLDWIKTQPRLVLVMQPEFLNICIRIQPPLSKDGLTLDEETQRDWSRYVRTTLIQNQQAMVNFAADSKGTFLRLILANPKLEFPHLKQILEWALEVN